MASPASPQPSGSAPADPLAIRGALPEALRDEFDHEWGIVLERVKESMDLAALQHLLIKWRHTATMEMRDPGSYGRMLGSAERILASGHNPDAASLEQMQALIGRRRGR